MRSILHGPEAYLLKSKKPHIIALIASAANMTADEIKLLPERPDVIKGLLNIKQQADQINALARATKIANMMMLAHPPTTV